MISRTIDLPYYGDEHEVWCREYIGTEAPYKDCVDENRPWCITHTFAWSHFHFAREQDAVMFALKWSNRND